MGLLVRFRLQSHCSLPVAVKWIFDGTEVVDWGYNGW
jgi:hypothetical protein